MASRASGELAVTAFLRVRVAMLWLGRLTQFSPVLLTDEVAYLLTTRDFELGKGTFCVSRRSLLLFGRTRSRDNFEISKVIFLVNICHHK